MQKNYKLQGTVQNLFLIGVGFHFSKFICFLFAYVFKIFIIPFLCGDTCATPLCLSAAILKNMSTKPGCCHVVQRGGVQRGGNLGYGTNAK